ncbi:nodulation S family protein [Komagataeibacter oboediens]|uniref:Methyltransferase n=1 Tax=Komagataeibacter oboediens TaxID=65958 RepID=A0A318QSB7_9PROT|nr:class I SAM-dependent methyltransferase [Komagataeibacter oboediens]MBV0888781.1 nodulation S family protein [Komagataeibacter oboediens]MBV1823988.1 nodulation S family protein [Komagataeibacter oboediens]MCK9821306.1 nodulation S family protein [Komagataeibacter oboediens]PYD82466.1 methyltransferase [Komagataeibacter oboediens]
MSPPSWSRTVFERLHRRRPDPWGVGTRAYEHDKYRQTLAVLSGRHFSFALELGCSIGMMTARLARRCERVLAVDVAEAALERARRRCAGLNGVSFYRGQVPDGFPPLPARACDLIVVSEMLYFLSRRDIRRLAAHCLRVRQAGAPIVLVNWTGPTDTPCTGDEAARHFINACRAGGLHVTHARRYPRYRLDVVNGPDSAPPVTDPT